MKFSSVLMAILGACAAEHSFRSLPASGENLLSEAGLAQHIAHLDFSGESPSLGYWSEKELYGKESTLPYRGVHRAGHFAWTAVDGKSPTVLRKLAKDEAMFKRLYEQNRFVVRRQLVYTGSSFNEQEAEIYTAGREILDLPGFDGEQLKVLIKNVDHDLSDGISAWNGHLEGLPNSTVQSTSRDSELQHIQVIMGEYQVLYESREAGQWIIQEIDIAAQREANRKKLASIRSASPPLKILAAQN